jgi:hypothetical protein
VRQQLLTMSAATGRVTARLNDLPVVSGYQQVLWTDGTGSALVIFGLRSAASIGVLRDGHYTPLPSSAQIWDAAW